jgi:hypothetical protein
LGEDTDPGSGASSRSPAVRIVGLIATNATLVVGVLVYMGWAYDTAFLGYFHLNPLDLDVGISEYILRSLDLFSPGFILGAVVVIAVIAARPWVTAGAWAANRVVQPASRPAGPAEGAVLAAAVPAPDVAAAEPPAALVRPRALVAPLARFAAGLVPADEEGRRRVARLLLIRSGLAIIGIALLLAWAASYVSISTYLILALLAAGPLILTWPIRGAAHGRFPYALAVVVAAVCTLWAASLYAQGVGTRNAQAVVRDLSFRTAVALYSTQSLALRGPGVTVTPLPPGGLYGFEYAGLRLLLARSGTYYLLPVGWYPGVDDTYVIDDSDTIRVVLYSGVVRVDG